jgi:hypothetical protein
MDGSFGSLLMGRPLRFRRGIARNLVRGRGCYLCEGDQGFNAAAMRHLNIFGMDVNLIDWIARALGEMATASQVNYLNQPGSVFERERPRKRQPPSPDELALYRSGGD